MYFDTAYAHANEKPTIVKRKGGIWVASLNMIAAKLTYADCA